MPRLSILLPVALIVAWLTMPEAGAAPELQVQLKLARANFVSLEPVIATVTVTNTIGKDVVVGGPGGGSWVEFEITRDGRPVSMRSPLGVEPIMLRAGETLQRDFNLARHFQVSEPGTYTVRVSAYFPAPLNRYSPSKFTRFSVHSARKPKWEQPVVVSGNGGRETYRRWQLFTFLDEDVSRLYVSLIDEHSGFVVKRFPLGNIVLQRWFQPMVDSEGNLHVLYAGNPSVYVHQTLDPGGNVVNREFYKNTAQMPQLVATPSGGVSVSGGFVIDPDAPAPEPDAGFRRLSDRPASLTPARN